MACFIAPVTEAVITTIAEKVIHSRECRAESEGKKLSCKFSEKLGVLNKMLWGGSALLAFEHLWHGEVVPFYPFLTAASDAVATSVMLHEIATSGVAMALLVTAVWAGIMCVGAAARKKSAAKESK
ncbi:MAG: hypothetical protein SOT68_07300 [Oscillospiraceae bacterium]|nr:hypothetical protein [Oscillospiraceae bacterium]MCI7500287.1 hypothetical protein [Oscillospiraceae bacterium]MDD7279988.1 hypothetical protein [Oscillospiraceae bacterium]MDY2863985.1 hypothetical protein [Oscillospiraceae bacterium]